MNQAPALPPDNQLIGFLEDIESSAAMVLSWARHGTRPNEGILQGLERVAGSLRAATGYIKGQAPTEDLEPEKPAPTLVEIGKGIRRAMDAILGRFDDPTFQMNGDCQWMKTRAEAVEILARAIEILSGDTAAVLASKK